MTATELSERASRVRAEQVETLLLQGISGTVSVGLMAGVYAYVVWPFIAPAAILTWLGATALLSVLRVWAAVHVRHRPDFAQHPGRWPIAAVALAAGSGAVWGYACVMLVPLGHEGLYFLLAALLTGMPAGAVSSFGVYFRAYAAYIACSVLPFSIRFMSTGDRYLALAGMASLVFGFFLLRMSWVNATVFRRNIVQRLELESLAASLEHARDAAESANRAKSSFLANMSHEIRTPLNAVVGLSELLQESSDNPKAIGHAATIRKSALSLLGIINDVLDLSRIEAGGMSLRQEPFSLPALLRDIGDMFAPVAERKGLRFTLNLDAALPTGVASDPVRLRQVLVNLLGNAMKFTEVGDVRLIVSVRQRDAARAVIEFTVTDTGIGIPPHAQETLFKPFTQVHDEALVTGGTGLGLAITAELIELMHGTIAVDSAPGRGASFNVILPLETVVVAPVPAGGSAAAAPADSVAGRRVLLVEDNEVNQVVASEMLRSLGCEIRIASTGKAALVEMIGERFDLVLMDCQMPGMNGFEATSAWRTHERLAGGHLPIVALTANAVAGDRENCLAAGMDDYLTKPVSLERLREVIARLAGGNQPPRTSRQEE